MEALLPVNLLFHGVGVPGRSLEPDEDRYWVSKDSLLSVLDYAAEQPELRLSFDDSNRSDVDVVLPALQARGLHATFFPISGRLDARGSLSRQGLRELVSAGMRVGTHGHLHVPWRHLSTSARTAELVTARRDIEDLLQQPVTEAACPFGAYERHVLRDLRELGYERVYTSDAARVHPHEWLQPRYTMTARLGALDVQRLCERAGLGMGRYVDKLRILVKRQRW